MLRIRKHLTEFRRWRGIAFAARARLRRRADGGAGHRHLLAPADVAVGRIGGRCRFVVRRDPGGIDIGLAHPAHARQPEHAARRRAQQHDPGSVHVRCAEPAAGLERALPRHVQHRPVAHLARLHDPRPARCAHRRRDLPARSGPLRRRSARVARARQDLHAHRRIGRRPRHRRGQPADRRRRLGGDARGHHRAQNAPSASSSIRARSSTASSRTCRRRSS